ncbi:MAG: YdbL family protein [Rhodanobacteraceae bacterium]
MRKTAFLLTLGLALLAGCVTINVYFPAAAAEKAAEKVISNVIGPAGQAQPQQPTSGGSSGGGGGNGAPLAARGLDMLIPAAYAAESQPDIKVSTPRIEALQASMKARYEGTLKSLLDSGAVGYTRDGLVGVHDASKAPLAARAQMNQAVADENRDRTALYRQIAAANGHPEWESRIRETFAKQWLERAHAGWYVQSASGGWMQK